MKRIAILQSDYIPWKGYFDIIRSVDELVILDDVQYTRRDWRNRNIIKTRDGLRWLTIPVKVKGRYEQLIRETEVVSNSWAGKHWKLINESYKNTDSFAEFATILEAAYQKAADIKNLSEINLMFLNLILSALNINVIVSRSDEYAPNLKGSKRIVGICREKGADEYLTGPSGLNYLETNDFLRDGIRIIVADYSSYPEYSQLYPPFCHNVSILDLILNTGSGALQYLKRF